jgi:hypothetical protein
VPQIPAPEGQPRVEETKKETEMKPQEIGVVSFKPAKKSAFTPPDDCIKNLLPGQSLGFHESANHSSANCSSICGSGGTCPELLPINCETFKAGNCDCTTVCKKAVELVSRLANSKPKAEPVVEQEFGNSF